MISIIISAVSVILALLSFIWGIIADHRNRKQQKEISYLKGKIEKSNYVSKVVFDTIFLNFQKISQCLFENYNNAAVRLFPPLEQTICMIPHKNDKLLKMKEFYDKSLTDLNELVHVTQCNRFILTDEMITELESFENIMKTLISCYDDKMRDIKMGSSYTYVTRERENEMILKGNQSMTLFVKIEKIFDDYIKTLQIIE